MKTFLKTMSALMLVSFFFTGCANKEDIQGDWYAYSYQAEETLHITIADKEVLFIKDGKEINKEIISISKTGFENRASYLVASLEGSTQKISFVFNDKDNKNEVFIFLLTNEDTPTSGIPLYKLDRNDFPNPEEGLIWN